MLFDTLPLRSLTLKNRIVVSPMCQYSSEDGFASDWHLVHLGSRAVGGAGVVFTEATAVEARGRISPQDLGLWKDEQIDMLRRITAFVRGQGAIAGIQLAHAGRKASTSRPWEGNAPLNLPQGGWRPILAPSALSFDVGSPIPEAMNEGHIREVTDAFAQATRRALAGGFQVVEIHAAHGYLLHEFLSPLTNQRTDARPCVVLQEGTMVKGEFHDQEARAATSDRRLRSFVIDASVRASRRRVSAEPRTSSQSGGWCVGLRRACLESQPDDHPATREWR